jgi:3'(2'), 5'-bisphosphate nucleotidase
MNLKEAEEITKKLIDTFVEAGNTSIDLRKKGLIKKTKEDNTPITNGDIEVNNILIQKIKKITPNIPIVSEETNDNKNEENLEDFWLIDPIDGTYDYVNNGEEFTLNAALIIQKKPKLALINAPGKKRLFYSFGVSNCFEKNNNEIKKLDCKKKSNEGEIIAVSYSDILKPKIQDIHKKYGVTSYKKMKSSLKFCVIASGDFDFYAAEPRACEWDIAAGHAILEHAGGIVNDFDGNKIEYGKKNFKNPSLILRRKKSL